MLLNPIEIEKFTDLTQISIILLKIKKILKFKIMNCKKICKKFSI